MEILIEIVGFFVGGFLVTLPFLLIAARKAPYQCQVCGRCFPTSEKLEEHKKLTEKTSDE